MEWTWAALRAERVLHEDDDLLVLDKPPGISVTGERHDTDVVRLAAEAGERLFPVHRIDKVTSGAVALARTLAAHGPLTRQFAERSAGKAYLAVVRGEAVPQRWTIDLPLGVGRKNRVRVAAPREALVFDAATSVWGTAGTDPVPGRRSYPSTTHVHLVRQAGDRALVIAVPATGRRHQIRVHLAWTGTPVLGDPLFPAPGGPVPSGEGPGAVPSGAVPGGGLPVTRTHLHSWQLSLRVAGRDLAVTAAPGEAFLEPVGGGGDDLLAAAEDVRRRTAALSAAPSAAPSAVAIGSAAARPRAH